MPQSGIKVLFFVISVQEIPQNAKIGVWFNKLCYFTYHAFNCNITIHNTLFNRNITLHNT